MTTLLHRSPTEAEARDHALVWWCQHNGGTVKVITSVRNGQEYSFGRVGLTGTGVVTNGLLIDPFGFPQLTDDLRARLIAEMEASE